MNLNRRNLIKRGALFVPAIFIPCVIHAQDQRANILKRMALQNAASGGGPCTTQQITNGGAQDDWNHFDFYLYIAAPFTTGASGFTACAADAQLFNNASPPGTFKSEIYTNNIASPGSLVGTASNTVNKSAVNGVFGNYQNFNGMSASLSALTTYWFVVQASQVDPNNSTIFYIHANSGVDTIKGSVDGTSWDSIGVNVKMGFKLYST